MSSSLCSEKEMIIFFRRAEKRSRAKPIFEKKVKLLKKLIKSGYF